jgi:hypothetical protein
MSSQIASVIVRKAIPLALVSCLYLTIRDMCLAICMITPPKQKTGDLSITGSRLPIVTGPCVDSTLGRNWYSRLWRLLNSSSSVYGPENKSPEISRGVYDQ